MPPMVMVNGRSWTIAAPDVEIITEDEAIILKTKLKPLTLLAPIPDAGVLKELKNPGGKWRMMVPPGCICLVGLKLSVTATFDLWGTRSASLIANVTDETIPKLATDTGAIDSRESDEVCTETIAVLVPAAAAPILNPLIVTVNGSAAMLAPDV
jgi:hypothetical protein